MKLHTPLSKRKSTIMIQSRHRLHEIVPRHQWIKTETNNPTWQKSKWIDEYISYMSLVSWQKSWRELNLTNHIHSHMRTHAPIHTHRHAYAFTTWCVHTSPCGDAFSAPPSQQNFNLNFLFFNFKWIQINSNKFIWKIIKIP